MKSERSIPHNLFSIRQHCRDGVAVVIVLAFVALLTGLVVAFFSRALTTRQNSDSSANQTKGELFAQGAVETIIADLTQEIAAGSNLVAVSSGTIYRPKTAGAAVPVLVGSSGSGGLENLIKRSAGGLAFFTGAAYDNRNYPPSNRAASVSSTVPSQNGRYISPARWNKHLLITRATGTSASDTTPVSGFTAPDWILVARDGSNPTVWDASMATSSTRSTSVVGRYAYAIYNEGGLLDLNVAGYPLVVATASPSSASSITDQTVYKSSLSYADLTQIKLTQAQVDRIVGWRNNATLLASGSVSGGYSFANPSRTSDNFLALAARNSRKFLSTANTSVAPNGGTDHSFVSRQQLMSFLFNAVAQNPAEKADLANALQYIGTFSRSLNQPSYWPDPNRPKISGSAATISPGLNWNYTGGNSASGADDIYNPPFRKIRVTGTFSRNDGTPASIGEPLVKKRFPLSRLAWLTCKGPSASLSAVDPLTKQYLANGISQQTLDAGTADNIYAYFGLKWTAGPGDGGLGGYWTYDHEIGSVIGTLDLVASANREPDFFELLKAGICVGSVAKAWSGNGVDTGFFGSCMRQLADTRVDFQIVQIAANIIDEADPDSFPTQIIFNDGSLNNSFWGKENLPYLSGMAYTAIVTAAATPAPPNRNPQVGLILPVASSGLRESGEQVAIDVPIVWNPFASSNSPTGSSLAPANLRVAVSEIPRDGSTIPGGFGSVVTYSGSGAPTKTCLCPWQTIGAYDSVTGMVKMPGSGSNTALYFSNNSSLYRDPTPLWQPGIPSGSNLNIDNQNLIVINGSSAWTTGIPELGGTNTYFGFYVGKYAECVTSGTVTYTVGQSVNTSHGYPLTCSLEYQSGGAWIPYMQYGTLSRRYRNLNLPYSTEGHNAIWYWTESSRTQSVEWDPRTARWGQPFDVSLAVGFLDAAKTMVPSVRPTGVAVGISHGVGTSTGWYNSGGYAGTTFCMGNVCQNLCSAVAPYFYYQDPDGTVRRGMAGAVSSFSPSSSIGIPQATIYNMPDNIPNRPVMLNRPFRSVAELGYVFRDTPWKNLDFSMPESGDTALMDVFCTSEDNQLTALSAGKVDLNTRQPLVIQAILAGAYRDELGTSGTLSATEAASLANALVTRTTASSADKGPLANVSELVGRYVAGYSNANGQPYAGFSEDLALYTGGNTSANNLGQRFRETAMRALSETGMAGTWNLLIDVVAQTGRYPGTATSLANFVVDGERHYWVHVAIDRQTGAIIDEQIEQVKE